MIFLTGDVHFKNKRLFSDQQFMSLTEAEAAKKYLQIADSYGIKSTLFFTGKSFIEEPDTIKEILKFKNLEIGGHTYNAYQPETLYRIFRFFGSLRRRPEQSEGMTTDSVNGPEWWQDMDVKKTIRAIKKISGKDTLSWRNHAYRYDKHTYKILKENGIRVVSNDVSPQKKFPEMINEQLVSLPINTTPDHEHLYHGEKKYIEGAKEPYGHFSKGIFYFIDRWFEVIKGEIESIEKDNGCATIIAHPSCMESADGMETFGRLCDFLSRHKTAFVREAIISNE
jgi:peptidoglycan/xylan/chitin deacetylase (PgdA/CDA1 family)